MEDVKSFLLKLSGVLLIVIIGYNLYTGATIQKVGIPGIFEIEFGQDTKGSTSSSSKNEAESNSDTNVPSAQISDVWMEHNVSVDGKVGMIIHTDFFVNHFKDQLGSVIVYFFHDDGTAVKDINGAFTTSDGQVSISDQFVPLYDTTRYEDFRVAIPYEEIVYDSGAYDLKFKVVIRDRQRGAVLQESNWVSFNLKNE